MEFHGKSGQELRTWILFIFGLGLVGLFAWQENPLNPWWTLIIGAFTCSAIIVSAVQTLVGGMSDAARRAVDEAKRLDSSNDPGKTDASSLSLDLGFGGFRSIRGLRLRHHLSVQ